MTTNDSGRGFSPLGEKGTKNVTKPDFVCVLCHRHELVQAAAFAFDVGDVFGPEEIVPRSRSELVLTHSLFVKIRPFLEKRYDC
jgi:hypothetical protein